MTYYSCELKLHSRSLVRLFSNIVMGLATWYMMGGHYLFIATILTIPLDMLDNPCLRKYIYEFLGFPPVARPYGEFLARPDAVRFIVT